MDLCLCHLHGQNVYVDRLITKFLRPLPRQPFIPFRLDVTIKLHDIECYFFQSDGYCRIFRSPRLSEPVTFPVFTFAPSDGVSWSNFRAAILGTLDDIEPEFHQLVMAPLESVIDDYGTLWGPIEVCLDVWFMHKTRVPPPLCGVGVIPRLKRLRDEDLPDKDENCAICFEGLKYPVDKVGRLFTDAVAVKLASCNHVFHEGCILLWLYDSLFCPLCRVAV